MERSLLWSALSLGCVGWLCGVLLTRARQGAAEGGTGLARPYLFAALALPVLVFLATLPSRPPFAAGQGWGRGFLLGGAGALLAAWVVLRALRSQNSPLRAAALVTAPCCAALVAVAIPLLWMRATVIDALLGVAIGWLVVSMVLFLGLSSAGSREETLDHSGFLLSGLAFAITLCATAALGLYRGGSEFQAARWSAAAMAFAAGVPFALLVSALPSSLFARIALKLPFAGFLARFFTGDQIRDLMSRGWRLLLCAALLLGLGKLLSVKVIEQPSLFPLVGLGLVVGLLAWWLTSEGVQVFRRSGVAENPEHPNTRTPEHLPPLAAMVVLSGFMAAFTMLAGFGVGILLLAAWPVVGLALIHALEEESGGPRVKGATTAVSLSTPSPLALTRLLLFGVILLLYRLFTTRFETQISGAGLTDHFALFGFLFGALLPALLVGLLRGPSGAPLSPTGEIVRLVLAGAAVLAAPALLLLLWGPKCALALLAGLALSGVQVFGRSGVQAPNTRIPEHLNASLFALAVALALTQWTSHILPLASMTRAEKIRIVIWVIGALIVLIAAADYGGRFGEWWRRRRPTLPPNPSPMQGERSR